MSGEIAKTALTTTGRAAAEGSGSQGLLQNQMLQDCTNNRKSIPANGVTHDPSNNTQLASQHFLSN